MRLRPWLVAAGVLLAVAACLRLGFWQLSRLHDKQRLNAVVRRALEAPAVLLGDSALVPAGLDGRRLEARGVYDTTLHVLLTGRPYEGAAGVHLITPLRLAGGASVLVDRGWIPSADAVTARPEDYPEPGPRTVTGLAVPLERVTAGGPWRRTGGTSTTCWSVHELNLDSVQVHLPYALAPVLLLALPETPEAARSAPVRETPQAADESMHLSYAIQWFVFAAILLGGSLQLALRGRGAARP